MSMARDSGRRDAVRVLDEAFCRGRVRLCRRRAGPGARGRAAADEVRNSVAHSVHPIGATVVATTSAGVCPATSTDRGYYPRVVTVIDVT